MDYTGWVCAPVGKLIAGWTKDIVSTIRLENKQVKFRSKIDSKEGSEGSGRCRYTYIAYVIHCGVELPYFCMVVSIRPMLCSVWEQHIHTVEKILLPYISLAHL